MNKNDIKLGIAVIAGAIFILGLFLFLALFFAQISVWRQSKYGEAELKKAEWTRQIVVKEAQAKKESSIMLAQAEVERAKGVAKANKIIGESLKGNESYLHYLWIDNLHNTKNQVIYIPTEAGMPVLEANRLK
jgi:hypothetical protein